MHWRNNHLLILLRNRSDTKSPFACLKNSTTADRSGYFGAMKVKNIRIHNRPAYNSEVHATRDMGVSGLCGRSYHRSPHDAVSEREKFNSSNIHRSSRRGACTNLRAAPRRWVARG